MPSYIKHLKTSTGRQFSGVIPCLLKDFLECLMFNHSAYLRQFIDDKEHE